MIITLTLKYHILMDINVYNDKFLMLESFLSKKYDMAIGLNDEDIKNIGDFSGFKVVQQTKHFYQLFFNTLRLDSAQREYFYNTINLAIKQLGSNSFMNNSEAEFMNTIVFDKDKFPLKKIIIGVKDDAECIVLSKMLKRHLSFLNIDVELLDRKLKENEFSDFIKENQYDAVVINYIDVYFKKRLIGFWGKESIGILNFTNYVPELLKKKEFSDMPLGECKKMLADELEKNYICLTLADYNIPALISNRFNSKQIEDYRRIGILYSLLDIDFISD